MKFIFNILIIFILSEKGFCQTKILILYKTDTSVFVKIQKGEKGISFVFPAVQGEPFYTIKSDSIWEKHITPVQQSIYGPYKFRKTKTKILFQNISVSNKFQTLYELTNKVHLSPNLYSSDLGYTISNTLLDSNAVLNIGNTTVPCFKFFQIRTGHNPVFDTYYMILYIDKANLLPCRKETYTDIDCTKPEKVYFMKTYEIL